MAGRSKIQDEHELVRWFEQGKTYDWMRREYKRKYNLEVGVSMFGNFRRRRGLKRRITRDDNLIPWEVKEEHRYAWDITMLRFEARRRAGLRPLKPSEEHQVDTWIAGLAADGAVVHYDPDTEKGWFHVPPRPGIDTDLIRVPDRRTTQQPNTDAAERLK